MFKRKVQPILREGFGVAYLFLKAINSASDACPPLKAATDLTLQITDLAKRFNTSKKEWQEFGEYVAICIANVVQRLNSGVLLRDELRQSLINLQRSLESILNQVIELQSQSQGSRLWTFVKDPNKITDMRKDLDRTLELFKLDISLMTALDIANIQESLDANAIQILVTKATKQLCDHIVPVIHLDTLAYVEGSAWNPSRVCLPGTRLALIESVMKWFKDPTASSTASIYWLADVAGSGKTALAHSIAQRCAEEGILCSSFFFDKGTATRSTPRSLIPTFARDLASRYPALAERIATTISKEPGISKAHGALNQFRKLIVESVSSLEVSLAEGGPIVFVIDALDEGYDQDLLQALQKEFSALPSQFRLFITSRPIEPITRCLVYQAPHISRHSLSIYDEANTADIRQYINYRLHNLAIQREIGQNWPDSQLSEQFLQTAGGLFIWVATVCDYLRTVTNPQRKLKLLLSDQKALPMRPQQQMDELYTSILCACDWDDDDFVEAYPVLVGTIFTAKKPLSVMGLESLIHVSHPNICVKEMLYRLGSLFTFSTDQELVEVIRVPHLSLRDFLISRAPARFLIKEEEHSERLALSCLRILNQDEVVHTRGTGFLKNDAFQSYDFIDVPEFPEIRLAEQVDYACRFWDQHLLDVGGELSSSLSHELGLFLRHGLVTCIVILCSCDRSPSDIKKVREWLSKKTGQKKPLISSETAYALSNLAEQLCQTGRSIDASQLEEEVVNFFKKVLPSGSLDDWPETAAADYAYSLSRLSIYMSDWGLAQKAASFSAEATEIYRHLLSNSTNPVPIQFGLAESLYVHSNALATTHQYDLSTTYIEEAVKLYRQLSSHSPVYECYLARALNAYSERLFDIASFDTGLEIAYQSLNLRRRLALEHSTIASFQRDLASTLDNYSYCLSDFGHYGEGLKLKKEALQLFQQTSLPSPSAQSMYASFLCSYSLSLAETGHLEEAVSIAEKAVTIYERLVHSHAKEYTATLSGALNALGLRLLESDRYEAACPVMHRSLQLRRALAAENPAVYNVNLANSLHNYSDILHALERDQEALEAVEESVQLRQQLVERLGQQFVPDLVTGLQSKSRRLCDLNRASEALHCCTEAVTYSRIFAQERPLVVAKALFDLYHCHSKLGQTGEALESLIESIKYHRLHLDLRPTSYKGHLASALQKYFVELERQGDGLTAKALDVLSETLNLHRQDYEACHGQDDMVVSSVSRAYDNLVTSKMKQKKFYDALDLTTEWVHMLQSLPLDTSEKLARIATALGIHCVSQGRTGQQNAALSSADCLLAFYRAADEMPHTPAQSFRFVVPLRNAAYQLLVVGHYDRALGVAQIGEQICRRTASEAPDIIGDEHGWAFFSLAHGYMAMRYWEEALQAASEAVDLQHTLYTTTPTMKHEEDLDTFLELEYACRERDVEYLKQFYGDYWLNTS